MCTQGEDQVIRFALQSASAPLAVATDTYENLPASERAALPPDSDLPAATAIPSTLLPPQAETLLRRLEAVHPALSHRRSISRAQDTMFDMDQGKDEATLIRNMRLRFSNGSTVELDDNQAAAIVQAVRDTYRLFADGGVVVRRVDGRVGVEVLRG